MDHKDMTIQQLATENVNLRMMVNNLQIQNDLLQEELKRLKEGDDYVEDGE